MKISINQAIYGEKNNAHALLYHTFSESNIPKDITLKTDLPSGHGLYPSWNHFYSAIGYGNHYIVMKIFPDTEAQRSAFVYTHALFIDEDDLAHIEDIEAVFKLFPKSLEKDQHLQTLELEGETSFTDDKYKSEATKKVAYGIINYNSPVVWLGKDGFLKMVRTIWNNLMPSERFNFQFRVSFGPKDIENTKELIIYTPQSLMDKWEGHFIVRTDDAFDEEYSESIAYLVEGPEKAPEIRKTAQQLDMSIRNTQELKDLSLLVGLLQIQEFNNILNAITLIQRLAPSEKKGASIKVRLINKMVQDLGKGGLKYVLSLRNLGQEHLGGFEIVSETVKYNLSKNFYSPEQLTYAISIVNSLNGNAEIWWLSTVNEFLNQSMKGWDDQHSKFFWNSVLHNHTLLDELRELLPTHDRVESSIIKHAPEKINKELLHRLIDFSKKRNWLSLHALLNAMAYKAKQALHEQLLVDTDPNFLDGFLILSETIPATSFINFTVTNKDSRLVKLSSRLIEKKPGLINDIEVSNTAWREIWKLRTGKGVDPFKGIKRPYPIVADLMDKLIEGEQVAEILLSAIAESKYASLLKYPNREKIWPFLQDDVRKTFLEATASDWLDNFLSEADPESIKIEKELSYEVFQDKYTTGLFNEQRYRSENILLFLERASSLSESTFISFLAERVEDFDTKCCQRIGQIIKTKNWANVYRKVKLELLAKNSAFNKTIEVCKGTFPLIDNPIYSGLTKLFGTNSKAIEELNENWKNTDVIKNKKESVVMLTAIAVEYNAVKGFLENVKEEVHPETETIYDIGTFGNKWNVALVETGAGNQKAATEAQRAIDYFKPTYVFFVGIAGGLKDVDIGDIVVASKVYGYETGKSDKDFKPRFEFGRSSYSLESRAKSLKKDKKWLINISQQLSQQLGKDVHIEAYIKPIAAGEKVVSSTESETYKFLKANASDALAVEMEGIGFLEVCHAYPNIKYALVRGISDLIDNKSQTDNDGGQELASLTAAAFAFEMLRRIEKSKI